jgi:hypothetical protein
MVLLALLAAAMYVMWQAQRKADFDWADMLRDDAGKPSAFRLAIFVSLGVSSWLLIYVTMKIVGTSSTWVEALNALFPWYAIYILVFSGAKIAERLVEIAAVKIGVVPKATP